VAVGGGGLLAGIATAIAALKPSVRVIGVGNRPAPPSSPPLSAANHPVTLDKTGSRPTGCFPMTIGTCRSPRCGTRSHESVQVTE
jgi:threonine dehydratase